LFFKAVSRDITRLLLFIGVKSIGNNYANRKFI